MNPIFAVPAYVLAFLYAGFLKIKFNRCPGGLNRAQIECLLRAIKAQMFSPLRNRPEDLIKNLVTAYFVSPGDLVVDVGAHMGRYAAYYSFLVGREGKVYAYEAHPQVYKKLKENLIKLPQAVPYNFAVSNASNTWIKMKIYPDELKRECGTVEELLMNSDRMPGKTDIISVKCQALDDLLKISSHNRCSLVKIDVEGHEHAVINGAIEFFRKHQPIVVYEYGVQPGVFEPRTIEQMNGLGYVSYDCKTLEIVPSQFPCQEPTDLIGIPQARVNEFEELMKVLKKNQLHIFKRVHS